MVWKAIFKKWSPVKVTTNWLRIEYILNHFSGINRSYTIVDYIKNKCTSNIKSEFYRVYLMYFRCIWVFHVRRISCLETNEILLSNASHMNILNYLNSHEHMIGWLYFFMARLTIIRGPYRFCPVRAWIFCFHRKWYLWVSKRLLV